MKFRQSSNTHLVNDQHYSGFTLIELVVSIGISSILLAGMTSSLIMAIQANDLGNGPFFEVDAASDAVAQIDRELSYATEITSAIDAFHEIEFVVPDQTGDGLEDLIRYQWSGLDDAPFERIFNNGTPQVIVPELRQFDIALFSKQLNKLGDATESSEQDWINQTESFWYSTTTIDKNDGIGTDFAPALPNDALSWSITAVDVQCSRNGSRTNGVIRARIYTADAQRKPDELVDQVTLDEANLPASMNWYTINFQNANDLDPDDNACVTFEGDSGNQGLASFRVLEFSFYSPGTWMITSGNNGNSWSGELYQDMCIRVRGKYVTQHSLVVNYCQYAKIQLRVGSDESSSVRSVVQTRNLPVVSTPE